MGIDLRGGTRLIWDSVIFVETISESQKEVGSRMKEGKRDARLGKAALS